jgi:hypothetical protein
MFYPIPCVSTGSELLIKPNAKSEPIGTAWLRESEFDPIQTMLELDYAALIYFIQHDLRGDSSASKEKIWDLREPLRLKNKQQDDGCWKYPSKSFDPETHQNYDLLETFRNLDTLIEMYAFDHDHPVITRAAEHILSCQTEEGDIRGILGNQYMPYYHGAILELLIKAGYEGDERVIKGLEWLLETRQEDGGWIVPTQAVPPCERNPKY